jgi:GNAT superfamily N-acetyltransferase
VLNDPRGGEDLTRGRLSRRRSISLSEIMTFKIHTRPAGEFDLDALLRHVAAGFNSYVEFAPAGWHPPLDTEVRREWAAEVLADPATWALLALADADPVGHVAFMPARERHAGNARAAWQTQPLVAGLAHLWQLFVLPDWWGRGVAPALHDAAIAEMRKQGYGSARLYTPSQHARARRFYERRGWKAADEAWNADLALPLTEYRLAL